MIELSHTDIAIRIVAALLTGAFIGLEREWEAKPAGMRTFAIVSLGAALFMIGGIQLANEVKSSGLGPSDPGRVGSTIVQGIGFLAAGVIITASGRVKGLTTAVSVWVTAAIGMLIGAGFLFTALVGSIALLTMLTIFRRVERILAPDDKKRKDYEYVPNDPNE